jgi:hypothetical protein
VPARHTDPTRHTEGFAMVYDLHTPYTILQNPDRFPNTLQRINHGLLLGHGG